MSYGFATLSKSKRVRVFLGDIEFPTCFIAPPKKGSICVATDLGGWWESADVDTETVHAPAGDGVLAFQDRLGPRSIILSLMAWAAPGYLAELDQWVERLSRMRRSALRVVEPDAGIDRESDVRLLSMRTMRRDADQIEVTLTLQADDPLRYSSVAISSAESPKELEARGLRVNLATNPSFESAVSQVVRTNLATNPSFEASVDGTVTVTSEPTSLRVGSFNVMNQRYANVHSGVEGWPKRAALVARDIVAIDAAIVGLQELQAWVFDSHLADILRELERIQPGVWDGADGANYNGFVWRKDQVDRTSGISSVVVNPTNQDSQGNRLMSWAVFRARSTGARFIFASTHFGDTQASRTESCSTSAAALNAASSANSAVPAILVADFNDPGYTNGHVYKLMADLGYENSRVMAGTLVNGGLNSYCDFDPRMVGLQNGNWIDGILVKGISTVTEAGVAATFADGQDLPLATPLASDHLPIYSDVVLPSQQVTAPEIRQQGYAAPVVQGGNAVCYQSRAWADRGHVSACVDTKATTSNTSAMFPAGLGGAMGRLGLTPGKTYTVGATVHLVRPQDGALADSARCITVGITRGGVDDYLFARSGQPANEPGTYRLSVTFTIPTDATNCFIRLMNGSTSTPVWWDSLTVEEGSRDKGPLDGDMTDVSGLYVSWTGDPHVSTTTMTAAAPVVQGTVGVAVSGGAGALAYQVWRSYVEPVAGDYVVRIDPRYSTGAETSVFVGGVTGMMDRLNMEPGETYTVSATLIVNGAQKGALSDLARRIVIGVEMPNARNHWSFAMSDQPPNRTGRYRLSVTFTIPRGASNCLIRLMNGSQESSVWWDALLIEHVPVEAAYFDGDSPGGMWLGAANESRSVLGAGDTEAGGAPLTNGQVFLPNPGDARAYPLIDVTYPGGDLTVTHLGGVWKLNGWDGQARRLVDCRSGDVFNAAGQRLYGPASGPWPFVEPGGSTWSVAGLGTNTANVRRSQAWT